ncbi:MAG: CsgG/HfaB family protein [Bordetella sp.]|uniref:CsgG/HfaB family protein n=1 Tax=Bordetella sp. TaxID=28081 RepID=UPI003F7C322C
MSLAAMCAIALSACGALRQPADASGPAKLTPPSPSMVELMQLPPPERKIVAAVYGFRDETGQYKPSPDSAFSTAVTQGASAFLIKALRDSGWYTPVEREGLQSLLTERRVLRAIEVSPGPNGKPPATEPATAIPNLIPASIIFEGGIVGYDTNTRTGGLGAKFLGISLSTQFSVDQVTVNLRAVDVNTGAILDSVSTTKTIYSYEVHPGYYHFVNYYDLLELEAGYTSNEPAQLAVKAAIDAAVLHLTVQGIENNLWRLRNPADINSAIIQRVLHEEETRVKASVPQASGAADQAEQVVMSGH